MEIIARYALGIGAAAALLAGCGGTTPTPGISGPIGALADGALGIVPSAPARHTSWFDSAKAKNVKAGYLYVSDAITGALYLYGYDPKTETGTQIGETCCATPEGICSDSRGNVYVVEYNASTVEEFAFGTLTVIKTLSDGSGNPLGCSVDPTTGNLAVANYDGNSRGDGAVLIYQDASGTPTQYGGLYRFWPPGYDPNGNLWVEGWGDSSSSNCVMELPKGGSTLTRVKFDQRIHFAGAAQWDGKYMDLLDQQYDGKAYQVALYQTKTSRTTLKAVNTVLPTSSCYSLDFEQWAWIAARPDDLPKTQATQIAAGNAFCPDEPFDIWAYPTGGNPIGEISGPQEAGGLTYVTKPEK
jgi:hypothetical protein